VTGAPNGLILPTHREPYDVVEAARLHHAALRDGDLNSRSTYGIGYAGRRAEVPPQPSTSQGTFRRADSMQGPDAQRASDAAFEESSEAEAAGLDSAVDALTELFADASEPLAEAKALAELVSAASLEEVATGEPVSLSRDEIRSFLQTLSLFEGISETGLDLIADLMTAVRYDPFDVICREGDEGDAMYLIREGSIRVVVHGKEMDVIPAGQFVGEMSLLDRKPRSATLVSEEETVLVAYTFDDYDATLRDAPTVGLALTQNIAKQLPERMRRTNERVFAEVLARERLGDEVRRAQEAQSLALPKSITPVFGDCEFCITYTAAGGVSGDYYDYVEFAERPHQLLLMMGDAMGHGLHACIAMLIAKSAAFAQTRAEPSVENIAAIINDAFCHIFGATMLMTFVCILLDRERRTIRYSNAGMQSTPFLYRMRSDEFVALVSETYQLGVTPQVEYTADTLSWEPGDLLIIYSDAITEAPYCPAGATQPDRSQEFGVGRLQAAIRANAHRSPDDITDAIRTAAKDFCRFYDSFEVFDDVEVAGDDVTTIIVRLR
jgi:serine phosphatase RsbU (regulator of sigma subunit)